MRYQFSAGQFSGATQEVVEFASGRPHLHWSAGRINGGDSFVASFLDEAHFSLGFLAAQSCMTPALLTRGSGFSW
jgi:hypothetical protein